MGQEGVKKDERKICLKTSVRRVYAQSTQPPQPNQSIPPPAPDREVDAAIAAELSGGAPARSSLHLVVAGHVDAGKSTLMGRLLHDLGVVTQKEAHKNLKEATQAGKVGGGVFAAPLGGRGGVRRRGP